MIHRFDSLAKVVVRAVPVLSNGFQGGRKVFRKRFPQKELGRCGFPVLSSRRQCHPLTRISRDVRLQQARTLTYDIPLLQNLKAPLLIVHAEDDLDIPVWHAQMLFDAFVEKHLPLPLQEITPDMMAAMVDAAPPNEVAESVFGLLQERAARRRELVRVREMERVGRVEVFAKDRADGEVVFLHTRWGAHDVGLVEGVQDFMAEMFNMGTSSARKSI